MKLISYNKQNPKPAFALIYVMLFIFLILVTVVITWATSMAENRLNQRAEGGAEAYQLAQAAIDDGWNQYHIEIGNACTPDDQIPSDLINYPDSGKVKRFLVAEGSYKEENFGASVTLVESMKGVYDYRITGTNSSDRVIEGIGYYKGTKITLTGKITNRGSLRLIGLPGLPPTSCEVNYSQDTMLIYQTGPSGS